MQSNAFQLPAKASGIRPLESRRENSNSSHLPVTAANQEENYDKPHHQTTDRLTQHNSFLCNLLSTKRPNLPRYHDIKETSQQQKSLTQEQAITIAPHPIPAKELADLHDKDV
ncbi:hypothetical protein BVRB_6g141070 [Beta vulgaris subsp. vulgaris]|nr:hypothetical protein BVRB_6g141070 [Beta vulgaris subsp. vulgaris]